jgi:hypothetical protein
MWVLGSQWVSFALSCILPWMPQAPFGASCILPWMPQDSSGVSSHGWMPQDSFGVSCILPWMPQDSFALSCIPSWVLQDFFVPSCILPWMPQGSLGVLVVTSGLPWSPCRDNSNAKQGAFRRKLTFAYMKAREAIQRFSTPLRNLSIAAEVSGGPSNKDATNNATEDPKHQTPVGRRVYLAGTKQQVRV